MKMRLMVTLAASCLVLAACGQGGEAGGAQQVADDGSASAEGLQLAPAFDLVDSEGQRRTLEEFRGRVVVLEWTNEGCPYVQKFYNAGAMQALQREATSNGVVWLTLISSRPGAQGYVEGDEARQWSSRNNAGANHLLLDPTGVTGQAYDARTTPDMRVIDEQGRIIYAGAIDDRPTNDPADIEGATNYVRAALADHAAGRAVAVPYAQPYGCSIKYPGVD
ncbi:MAG: redoxin family protein [Brevundimonas sp.]|uniref:redoxin family protein n=1 Tax=Brevundimonas sp. TaxID=1871086 RepID=UPI0039191050